MSTEALIAGRHASAEVRAAVGRLRRSIDALEDKALSLGDARTRRLLARAASAIMDAYSIRVAASRIPQKDGNDAMFARIIEGETAHLMNACHDHIFRLTGPSAYAEFRGDPLRLAMAVAQMLQATEKPTKAAPKPEGKPSGRQAFDAQREAIKPKTVTASLKAVKTKSADGKPMLLATASSDATDLENDYFTIQALRQMAAGLKGKLIFANHRYAVPEDVVGQAVDTSLVKRAGLNMLDLMIEVATENPRAVQVYDMVRGGTRLGVSVGVLVKDSRREKDGRTAITDVIPLEASIVGIPANQTAWTQGAS